MHSIFFTINAPPKSTFDKFSQKKTLIIIKV